MPQRPPGDVAMARQMSREGGNILQHDGGITHASRKGVRGERVGSFGSTSSIRPLYSLLDQPGIQIKINGHSEVVKQSVARNTLDLGLRHYTRADLEAIRASQQTLALHVLGLLSIADDVSPELARATISSITVLGALHASAEVKAALADRMR